MWTQEQVKDAVDTLRSAATLAAEGQVRTARETAAAACIVLPLPDDEREDALWWALSSLAGPERGYEG